MPRKPQPKSDDAEQSKRFVETAREIGADESKEGFERAFKKVVPESNPQKRPAAAGSDRKRARNARRP